MDLDTLKTQLAEQDAKLDQVLRLNTMAVREIQPSKMKSSLRWLVPGIVFELLLDDRGGRLDGRLHRRPSAVLGIPLRPPRSSTPASSPSWAPASASSWRSRA